MFLYPFYLSACMFPFYFPPNPSFSLIIIDDVVVVVVISNLPSAKKIFNIIDTHVLLSLPPLPASFSFQYL